MERILDLVQVLQLLRLDTVVSLNIHEEVVHDLVSDDGEHDSIGSESASSSRSVEEVGDVCILPARIHSPWHIVVDNKVGLWDVDTPGQEIGAEQSGVGRRPELIDDFISFLVSDASLELRGLDSQMLQDLLQV